MEQIEIKTEYIKLSQLLKLANVVCQGSDVKLFLASGAITVNGEIATERGKKIRPGDRVKVASGPEIEVLCRTV